MLSPFRNFVELELNCAKFFFHEMMFGKEIVFAVKNKNNLLTAGKGNLTASIILSYYLRAVTYY